MLSMPCGSDAPARSCGLAVSRAMDGAPISASETGAARVDPPPLDWEAFGRLYREAYPALRIVAISTAGADRADDVVQQAAIVAMERLDRFTPGTNFRAWMSAIVRGVARNERRGERRHADRIRRFGNRQKSTYKGPDPSSRSTQAAAGSAFATELSLELRNALDQLGPQQKECFLLRTILDCSYEEIAIITEMPEATARSHVRRARLRLLQMLDHTHGREAGSGGASE